MSGIYLSEKYGVNPSLVQCFWCGGDTSELVLFGAASRRLTGQEEAPRHVVMNYVPCDKCKADMELGITLMEADDKPQQNNMHSIDKGRDIFPTGRWWVITAEAAERMFAESMYLGIRENHNKAFIDRETVEKIGLDSVKPTKE